MSPIAPALRSLAMADERSGGKARNLRRLIEAGLPVPDGFVLDAEAFVVAAGVGESSTDEVGHALTAAAERIASGTLEPALEAAVIAQAAQLGELAVRSSATFEDSDAGAAAGVFSSHTAVPAKDVWAAIRAVWTSALTPLAVSYARQRAVETVSIGVIVQQYVRGTPLTIYTRPPGSPTSDEVLVQRAALTRASRDSDDAAVVLALRAEAAIGASSGADVELVERDDGALVVVQARPVIHPTRRARMPAPPPVTAVLVADGRTWTWDIAHNPDPLSTAQAELVERVDRAGISPWALRVCAGYLYTAARELSSARQWTLDDSLEDQVIDLERRLGETLEAAPSSVEEAVRNYIAFYAIWSRELSPLVSALKRHVAAPSATRRPSSVEATLLAAAREDITTDEVLARLGPLSPAWDVAAPTYAERPQLVHDAIARARGALPARTTIPPAAGRIELAAELAERDDVWFARAQWMVRSALRARARALVLDEDDVFWLPFDAVTNGLSAEDARRRAAGARAAAARAARWEMPLVVGGGAVAERIGGTLRGEGSGGRASGRVVRFATLASAIAVGPGDVVVTRAVTPALAVLVIGCAALISETGGLLDHGAAMAREMGIPCVVGCSEAWSALEDGMLVDVDGDAGSVSVRRLSKDA